MTRQKKEIIKKMDEIREFIEVDRQLGCGCAPANAYAELEEQIWNLGEQLAKLSHFNSYMEYMMDERGMVYDPELPFA